MKMTGRIGAVAVLVMAVAAMGGAAQTVSVVPLGNAGTTGLPTALDADTVKVQGRGVGLDKAAALKDAYRDAIEHAVGLYVDAETVASNNEIVKDQVLTQSNAYITNYRELSEEKIDGGLVQLRIIATVKKRALAAKLSGIMPAQTVTIDSASLRDVHAQLVTKEKRAEDAAALLRNALSGLNPMKTLMVASIRPETQKVITEVKAPARGRRGNRNATTLGDDSVTVRYLCEVKLDRAKYFAEFVPHLKSVLDQISLTPPKEARLVEMVSGLRRRGRHGDGAERLKKYLEMSDLERGDTSACSHQMFRFHNRFTVLFDPVHVYSILWGGEYWALTFRYDNCCTKIGESFRWKNVDLSCDEFNLTKKKETVYFALITSLNADGSDGKVTIYELDKFAIEILNTWRRRLDGERRRPSKTTNYNIVLLGKDGVEQGTYPWQIPNDVLENVKFGEFSNAFMVYATPFVGCVGEKLIQWRDFILEKDQLDKVTSIKIELAD